MKNKDRQEANSSTPWMIIAVLMCIAGVAGAYATVMFF